MHDAEPCQVRDRQWLFARASLEAAAAVARDTAERVGANVAEALSIVGRTKTEGVENKDDRASHKLNPSVNLCAV